MLSPGTSSEEEAEAVPETPEKEQNNSVFESQDLEDPFPCPVFDLGNLDNSYNEEETTTDNNTVTNTVLNNNKHNNNRVSNVAVLASESIEVMKNKSRIKRIDTEW